MFVADTMANVLKLAAYVAVSVALVYSRQYLLDRGLMRGEFLTLLLFALLGMMVMISAQAASSRCTWDWSCCRFACTRWSRSTAIRRVSTEAAMKYFVLGALASGLLLYGMSMIYGATGTLNIVEVAQRVREMKAAAAIFEGSAGHRFLVFGLVFVVSGLAFKLGVVPFHMWIPDVYQGAPTAVTLVIGSAPKLAAFAMAMRLLVNGLLDLAIDWQQMLVILAVAVDGARQHHRHRAVEPQAHARVLDHRAHGLHAARAARRRDRRQPAERRRTPTARPCSTPSSTC